MMMLRVLAVVFLFSTTTITSASALMIQRAETFLFVPRLSTRGTLNHAKPISLSFLEQKCGVWSVSSNPSIHVAAKRDNTGDEKVFNDKRKKKKRKKEAPNYNPKAKASEFFSNEFFYVNDETFAASPTMAKLREDKFGNKTVEAVLKEIASDSDIEKYFNLFNSGFDAIQSYWREIRSSIEERLDGLTLNLLDGSQIELQVINERYVDLSIQPSKLGTRENDICVVLGPSGSGKTFFATKVAAAFYPSLTEKVEVRYSMTIYLKASAFIDKLRSDPTSLVQPIRRRIEGKLGEGCFGTETDVSRYPKLNMHVSVVIDEAGNERDRFFEEISNLNTIYECLKENLAKRIRLIVGGTGLTAEKLNSESDVRKYRMKEWSQDDVKTVATKKFQTLPAYVLDFAHTRPMLHALTSNARAAWFLLDELTKYADFRKYPKRKLQKKELKSMLDFYTVSIESTIIPQVAAQYIKGNGLKNLSKNSCMRVATMVFSEVDKSMQENGPSSPNFFTYTKDPTEVKMANALINVNVDFKDGVLKYADETKTSILLSPAITIVLFYLLGVEVGVLSSWKGLEVMTALHAFRKQAISIFSEDNNTTKRLRKVRLISLQAVIPATNAQTTIQIPILNPYTVWINGDKAPFADVVAPHFLFQCKYTEQDTSQVKCNLYLELLKCGLLLHDASSRGKIGRVTLNGIIEQWNESATESANKRRQGKNPAKKRKLSGVPKRPTGVDNENDNKNDIRTQCLIYYPESEIETVSAPKDAGIDFAEYDVDKIDKELSRTQEFSRELNFVVATNAKEIVLSFENDIKKSQNWNNETKTIIKDPEALSKLTKWELRVTNKDIDNNGILQTDDSICKLNEIKELIRGNVTLRFYLGG